MNQEGTFKILALDGGGARGIYAAQLLARIEQEFDVCIKDCFDLVAGTSTGSIIGGGAAVGIPMIAIVHLFESKASQIFRKKLHRCPLFVSKYSKEPLKRVLDYYLPSITFGRISSPLMITSSDISTGGVHVFKSSYLNELGRTYVRDKDVQLRDGIIASCAAPTYFAPEAVGNHLLSDGGLWANNPSMISCAEAISKFSKNLEQIKILSLGTGYTATNRYSLNTHAWGFLTGWKREKFISHILDLQSQASTNMAELLLKENYLRLDCLIDNWELDSIKNSDNLKSLADKDFAEQANEIRTFIEIGGKNR